MPKVKLMLRVCLLKTGSSSTCSAAGSQGLKSRSCFGDGVCSSCSSVIFASQDSDLWLRKML